MSFHPTTSRLVLRRPVMADMAVFVQLLDDFEVSKNLRSVPCPYTEQHFADYLRLVSMGWNNRNAYIFAVTRVMDGALIGICAVEQNSDGHWELGYWYGRSYWGQGYATEAAQPMLRFAFDDLNVAWLAAGWFFDNPASGRVLEKLGFVPTGTMRRFCLSRGCDVISNRVQLTRAQFARKKAA